MKRIIAASLIVGALFAAVVLISVRATADTPVDTSQKVVPIISLGSGLRVGAALVAGEDKQVEKVKAVAQLEGEIGAHLRIRALVPVETEDVIKNIRRVPGTSVIAFADVKL